METIPRSDCEKVGFFRKTHGVHGDVVLEFESHFEYSVEASKRFFVELEGLLVPFFVAKEGMRFTSSKSVIVTFDWVDTEGYAKRLIGSSVYLFNAEIIDEPDEIEATFEGYLLLDESSGEIGMVIQENNYSGNIVLTVNYRGNEILIPYNDKILIALDEVQKTITLQLPDGLLENNS